MSAENLRRAAALMRERAKAATPGPWNSQGANVWCPHHKVGQTASDFSTHLAKSDATHIAGMHPAVALAVADWLDAEAHWWEYGSSSPGGHGAALAVANAYLGEVSQ